MRWIDLLLLGEPLRNLRNYELGFASQREEVNKVLTGVCEQTKGFELDKESIQIMLKENFRCSRQHLIYGHITSAVKPHCHLLAMNGRISS